MNSLEFPSEACRYAKNYHSISSFSFLFFVQFPSSSSVVDISSASPNDPSHSGRILCLSCLRSEVLSERIGRRTMNGYFIDNPLLDISNLQRYILRPLHLRRVSNSPISQRVRNHEYAAETNKTNARTNTDTECSQCLHRRTVSR